MNIIIGRYINGISVNGLGYLLDDSGEEMEFKDKQHAIEYLKTHYPDATEEEIEDSFVFKEKTDGNGLK
jgi:hypothetical protein